MRWRCAGSYQENVSIFAAVSNRAHETPQPSYQVQTLFSLIKAAPAGAAAALCLGSRKRRTGRAASGRSPRGARLPRSPHTGGSTRGLVEAVACLGWWTSVS